MRLSRLFVDQALAVHDTIQLNNDSAHYLRSVLRTKKGHSVILFNGEGGEYQGEVSEISRKQVLITLSKFNDRSVESNLNITLGLGISRGERMDFSIQKSVELGINQICPLVTEHCSIQIKNDKKEKKVEHWQKISQNAAEQSSRTINPKVADITIFSDWVAEQAGTKLFLDPFAKVSLTEIQNDTKQITLLAGPEGGFSEQEREIAIASGFTPIKLGPRILRTETAALAALTAVQTLWGDFNDH